MSCPCGSGGQEAACCGRWLASGAAPTAEALMRSRYTAYVRGEVRYLVDTHDVATRGGLDVDAITRWARQTTWLGLEIIATERGTTDDDEGTVEFIARGSTEGAAFAQRETSRFRRVDQHWYYVDGVATREPTREPPRAGRNEPCPCGSGLKFKRCHG